MANCNSGGGGEAAAFDSDGSISWEDFYGSTTDLVPQLLGMFDELARNAGNDFATSTPQQLQKRLSFVHQQQQQRRSNRKSRVLINESYQLLQQRRCGAALLARDRMAQEDTVDYRGLPRIVVGEDKGCAEDCGLHSGDAEDTELDSPDATLRYSASQRRCRAGQLQRPVSGSSIASSTASSTSGGSSSSCCNHHHRHNASGGSSNNPYLASVESLADTCASSQGSGDSGVVVSEPANGANSTTNGGGNLGNGAGALARQNARIRLSDVDRATAARYFDERRPRYCDPQRRPVERVLLEIVDTEAVYVEHLRQVIQGYLIFWRDDPASLIRELELSGLFSNIEDIFEFNRNFLSSLDTVGIDPIAVANTFVEHNAGFKVYTEYCTNYPRTVSILKDLMNQEDIAEAFRERQAALGHQLPLGSFLLKPVQRILKYHLLLEHLSKEYESDASSGSDDAEKSLGRQAIEEALKAMTGIASHINEMKRKHEHAVRVQEIQSLLYGWPGPDLTTSGELIAEGSFRVRGAKAPRHAFLFDSMLLLTKKREDGLLVYKAHIMCSNLTMMESIPGEPLCFHVIPFDNSQVQYKLQARNVEQKREWTLQIKRVILENYNAVIPSHARQLVLQIGQDKSEDDATPERGYKKSADHFDARKSDRERRRSEASFRQKLKKGRKSDISISTADNSPMCSRKNQSVEAIGHFGSRDDHLNRSSEIRESKIKNRFTNWRRKSEPGFQCYITLNPSDNEEEASQNDGNTTPTQELINKQQQTSELEQSSNATESQDSSPVKAKETYPANDEPNNNNNDNKNLKQQQQSVEEIVGDILMHSEEFQKRLEKQRNHSSLHCNILKHGNLRIPIAKTSITYSSEEELDDSGNEDSSSKTPSPNNKQKQRFSRREQCFVSAINAYNQRSFRSQYDSFRNVDTDGNGMLLKRLNTTTSSLKLTTTKKISSSDEKRTSPVENFKKKPNLVLGSKVMRTALRIRENCDSASEHEESEVKNEPIYETPNIVGKDAAKKVEDKGNLSNYDNLQHAWHDCLEPDAHNVQDCPTKTAVWLTKLCEGLPDQPQKCGSLPRSFQMMNPADLSHVTKSRFLQRDGKSMTERPFTIASDKPAEINLEDMERYASSCQGSSRIAKFPTGGSSTSSSTFFCSLDDSSFTDTDSMTRASTLSNGAHVHPDHKIYRANGSASKELTNGQLTPASSGSSLRSYLSRAGSRLQGLRSSQSTETLECSEEFERTRFFRSFSSKRNAKHSKTKYSSAASDAEETVNCVIASSNGCSVKRIELPYHKQGSSSLGARIAQSDYADPRQLFLDRRTVSCDSTCNSHKEENEEDVFEEAVEALENDSFYEKSFDTIENYADGENDEANFRDSAIFSDVDEASLRLVGGSIKKVPPPVPLKRKLRRNCTEKPTVAQKPAHLKFRTRIVKCHKVKVDGPRIVTAKVIENTDNSVQQLVKENDVSAGQSQVGWVKKMVGQLQAQVDV